MANAWPVMKELAGSEANKMAMVFSSTSATRFIGMPRVSSANASVPGAPETRTKLYTIPVLVWAGQMASMRRPLLAHSTAAERVRHAMLGGCIDRKLRRTRKAGDRGNVDDGAALAGGLELPLHLRDLVLHGVEDAEQVDLEHPAGF